MMNSVYQRPMPADQINAYYEVLSDIPKDALHAAVLRAIQESEQNFIPPPGLIRRLATEAQYGVIPPWGQEWERVLIYVRRFGRARASDAEAKLGPFTWRIVRQVGWQELCNTEAIGVQLSQFRDLYNSAAQAETTNRRISEELRPVVGGTRFLTVPAMKRLGVNP